MEVSSSSRRSSCCSAEKPLKLRETTPFSTNILKLTDGRRRTSAKESFSVVRASPREERKELIFSRFGLHCCNFFTPLLCPPPTIPLHADSYHVRRWSGYLESSFLQIVPDAADTCGLKCRHLPGLEPAERHSINLTSRHTCLKPIPLLKSAPTSQSLCVTGPSGATGHETDGNQNHE